MAPAQRLPRAAAAAAALFRGTAATASWIAAVRGPCEQVGTCVQSPNYPGRYGGQQTCEISVSPWAQESVSAVRFRTERNYDVLTLNGRHYSGHFSLGPRDVVATGTISWSSDGGVESTGWKICRASEADAERAAEPPVDTQGFELFIYAFMTVMVVWLAPSLIVAPFCFTILCLLVGCFRRCENLTNVAIRIAHFPYMTFRAGTAPDGNDGPFKTVGYCILWWGTVSITLVMLIVILFVAVTLSITYVFGLLTMILFFTLLTLMETVAKRASQNDTKASDLSGSSNSQVDAAKYDGKLWQFLRHPCVKWTYRTLVLLAIAFAISVGVFFQFLVDAMLIESGFDLLPSSGESSDTLPVYAVMHGMKGDFAIMSLVSPAFELFRPILKWFRAWLDLPVACNPAAWSAYSVVCVSAAYVQFVWCATDVASPLHDRQKRLEVARSDESAGNIGFLKQKFYALVVLIILKLNFYTLQLVGQSIISGFPGMMSHDPKYCDVKVVHPHGIELGYAASWLIARLMSYYSCYVLGSALFFILSGVHYDLGMFISMSRLTKEGIGERGLAEYTKKLNALVLRTLPIFLQGVLILAPQRYGTRMRAEIAETVERDITELRGDSGYIEEVKRYMDDASIGDGWGSSWKRFILIASVVPATFGIHSHGFARAAYLQRLRCIVWNPVDQVAAQPENIQLATGKVLALAMTNFPAIGVAYAKLLEYNNESSAWLWTSQEKDYPKLPSRLEAFFGEVKTDDVYPLHPWITWWKFGEYLKWVYHFVLSVMVVSAAARPSEGKFVLVFITILALNLIDVLFQLYNKHKREHKQNTRVHPDPMA